MWDTLRNGAVLVTTDPTQLAAWGRDEQGWMVLATYLSGLLAVLSALRRCT